MKNTILFAFAVVVLPACTENRAKHSGDEIYTLYRGGVIDPATRIHLATFETQGEDASWNKQNCEDISRYLTEKSSNQLYSLKFWCEKGKYRE